MLIRNICIGCVCFSVFVALMVAGICVTTTMGWGVGPITVTGPGNTHIQEIKNVRNSIFDINSRINAANGDLGSILALVVLILMARAAHHIFIKRPIGLIKRENRRQTDDRIVAMPSKAGETFLCEVLLSTTERKPLRLGKFPTKKLKIIIAVSYS